ncbi:MAG: flap endonuclease, partial [Chloroflexota bacterium]
PGIPGYGAKTAAALLSRYGHLEDVPIKGSSWHLAGVRNQVGLAQVLRERLAEAMLYRDLARLRTAADGVEIPQKEAGELEWLGAPRARWEAFCDEWGLDRLRSRPHRWLEA